MSDSNQQCPSNWNTITTSVRGCGRSTKTTFACDSVFYPVNGRTYSSVCGRVIAYQEGVSYGFRHSDNEIDIPNISGMSLTHGPPGSRHHIWSFIGAYHEIVQQKPITAHVQPQIIPLLIPVLYMLAMITSVTLPTLNQVSRS